MNKWIYSIVLIIFVVFLLFWPVSVLKCERLTDMYAHEFSDAREETNLLSECETFKILEYTESYAVGYYITIGSGSGNKLYFERENGQDVWNLSHWETIWSTSGSADGFLWPYIR